MQPKRRKRADGELSRERIVNAARHARRVGLAMQLAKALLDSPDFIRLGLMLALERRPVEPRARSMFLQTRAQTCDQLIHTMRGFAPELTGAQIHLLVTYPMAGPDRPFIPHA